MFFINGKSEVMTPLKVYSAWDSNSFRSRCAPSLRYFAAHRHRLWHAPLLEVSSGRLLSLSPSYSSTAMTDSRTAAFILRPIWCVSSCRSLLLAKDLFWILWYWRRVTSLPTAPAFSPIRSPGVMVKSNFPPAASSTSMRDITSWIDDHDT